MNDILTHLKQLKEMYTILLFFVGVVITAYTGYTNIIDNIESNTKAVEITQITMLKSIQRDFEKHHKCKVSDAEWDEYILNYSTLFDLKVAHKILSEKARWLPIERQKGECK